jgi:hypothetical protein
MYFYFRYLLHVLNLVLLRCWMLPFCSAAELPPSPDPPRTSSSELEFAVPPLRGAFAATEPASCGVCSATKP